MKSDAVTTGEEAQNTAATATVSLSITHSALLVPLISFLPFPFVLLVHFSGDPIRGFAPRPFHFSFFDTRKVW